MFSLHSDIRDTLEILLKLFVERVGREVLSVVCQVAMPVRLGL